MKLVCCSKCGKVVSNNKTSIVENKRICHDCKKSNKWEMQNGFRL